MICKVCGAEVEDNSAFCTSCGAKIEPAPEVKPEVAPEPVRQAYDDDDDDEKTTIIENSQAAAAPMGQPQANPFGQPMSQQPPMGQPQANPFGQPMPQQQPPMGQPQANPFGQPMPQQQPPMGQPMGQPPYGQPMGQPMGQPKPPKKPMPKGAKIGIIAGIAAVAIALIVVFVVLPLINKSKKSELEGLYVAEGYWGEEYVILDDGTYVVYEDEKMDEIYEAGYYTQDDNNVTFNSIDGYTTMGTYDDSENNLTVNGAVYECKDEDAELDIELDASYMDTLKKNVDNAIMTSLANEAAYDAAVYSGYYYYSDDALDSGYLDDFGKEFVENLGYENDTTLQTLMRQGYVYIDIYVYSDGSYEVYVSAY